MLRFALFFLVVIPCAGFSALQWTWRYTFNRAGMNLQDEARVEYAFGITHPDMDIFWKQALKAWSFHELKNVASEWNRLDVQRGVKFLSLVILFWVAVSVVLAIALALVVLL